MNINLDALVKLVENELVLSEQNNEQSIYGTSVKLRFNKNRSGDITQVLNEVRGIEGVTTVSHKADYARQTETYSFVIFDIKYELIGRDSNPIDYIKNIFVPGIRKIQGIDLQDITSRPQKISK